MGQVHFPSLCNDLYPGFEAWNPGDSPNGWRCLLIGSGGQRTVRPVSSDQINAWCRKEYGDDVSARLQNPNNVYGWQCWANTDIKGVTAELMGSRLVPVHEPLPPMPTEQFANVFLIDGEHLARDRMRAAEQLQKV